MNNYKKYANEILDDVETYKLVLSGKLAKFPNGFWTKPYSLESSKLIVRYLIEERYKLKIDDIPKVVNTKFMIDNKLNGMIKRVFGNSAIEAIENAYPNRFKPWEFKKAPSGLWLDKNNVRMAMRWLIEEELKWNEKELLNNLCYDTIENSKITGVLNNYNLYDLVEIAYPNKFKPWQFKRIANEYWSNKENALIAMRWLIEEKLKWNEEQIKKYYNTKVLMDNGVGTLQQYYGTFGALNIAYPNRFKPWELDYVGNGFWDNKENRVKAIKWLLEEKLGCKSKEDILKVYKTKTINKYGLASLNNKGMFENLNLAYPGMFNKSEFNGNIK